MTEAAAGLDEKRAFLRWLGTNHVFKDAAVYDIVRFFLASPERLKRLRLIEDCSYLRPLLVIATAGQSQPALLYQTATGSSRDPEVIVADLALTVGPVFLAPYFPRRAQAVLFQRAKEKGLDTAAEVLGQSLFELETRQLLAGMDLADKGAALAVLIDQALERRDEEAFHHLVRELKKLPPRSGLTGAGRRDV